MSKVPMILKYVDFSKIGINYIGYCVAFGNFLKKSIIVLNLLFMLAHQRLTLMATLFCHASQIILTQILFHLF